MNTDNVLKRSKINMTWSLLFAILCALLAGLILVGWLGDIDQLKNPLNESTSIQPVTAFFFLLSSISIFFLTKKQKNKSSKYIGLLLAFVLLVCASIILGGTIWHYNTTLFQNGLPNDTTAHFNHQMDPNTAAVFILSSLALLLLDVKINKIILPSQFIVLFIGAIATLSFTGNLYYLTSLYSFKNYMPLTIYPGLSFSLLAFSILLVHKDKGFMHEITGNLIGSVIARKLIPAAILIPLALGILRLYISSKITLPGEFGIGLLIACNVTLTLTFIWYFAGETNRKNALQNEAEKQIKEIANRLKLATRSSGVGIWELDLSTNKLSADEQIYKLYGLTNDFNLDPFEGVKDRIYPDDLKLMATTVREAMTNRDDFETEFRIIWPDNSIRYIKAIGSVEYDAEGNPSRLIGTNWDITASKLSEKKLFEYKHFFVNSNDLLCIANTNGYLELINSNFVNILGYTEAQLTQNPFLDFVHPDDIAPTTATMELLKVGNEIIHFKNRYRKNNGDYIWLDWNATSDIKTGKLYCIARDISEQKKIADELEQSNIFLDTIIENIPNMIFVKDAKDFKFVRFNRAGENLLGYNRRELIGKSDFDFFPEEQARMFKEKDLLVLQKGTVVEISEEKIQTATSERWLYTKKIPVKDKNGKPLFLLGISEDITERRIANEKLMEFKHFFNNSSDLASILNFDGTIDILNPNYSKILGYTDEELAQRDIYSFLHPDELSATTEVLQELVNGNVVKNHEFRLQKKDGSYGWFEVNSTPNVKSQKIYSIIRDTSDRKKTEQLILEQTNRLKIANEELETFSYSVSHDLRAPLRSLEGFSKALLANYQGKLDEDADRWLQFIESNARRMGVLISDMLAFSKITRVEILKSKIDMTLAAEKAFDLEKINYSAKKINFQLDELPVIYGDTAMIRQVWQNLISNALKYSSKKDEINIKISSQTDKDFHSYIVQDNGAGFDENYKEKLFVVFQRLHSSADFEGTGVGLAISHRIIKKHGGEIDATSVIGQGTKFIFKIPKQ